MGIWRDSFCSSTGRINIVKMYKGSRAFYSLNVIPIKFPIIFFSDKKTISKFIQKHKGAKGKQFQIHEMNES